VIITPILQIYCPLFAGSIEKSAVFPITSIPKYKRLRIVKIGERLVMAGVYLFLATRTIGTVTKMIKIEITRYMAHL
jgi:hypothetical protein